MKKLLFILIYSFVTNISIQAQFFCVDPNRAIPNYPCPDPSYKPVCGCDGVTYRNICEAQMRHGVQFWTDGPCSGFEFDVIPTFLDVNNTLRVSFVSNTGITAQFVITDFWGKVLIQQVLPASVNATIPFVFDLPVVSTYRPGLYIMLIYDARGNYRFRKFVKA
ncbi:MAG: Kazal-type serine protease inhibitor family protein [Bacteroidia bacterium]